MVHHVACLLTFICLPLGTALLAPSESLGGPATAASPTSFPNFESPQVRPITISEHGLRLYALNTPANLLKKWPKTPIATTT